MSVIGDARSSHTQEMIMHKLTGLTAIVFFLTGSALPALAQDAVVQLSPDQRTTVIQDFSDVTVTPAPDVEVTVGAAVPKTVTLEPVPDKVIKVVPGYRKYKYFKTGKGIVIVDPDTMK